MPGGRVLSLDAFIIDKIRHLDDNGQALEQQGEQIIGGAGTYAMIGARMFLPPERLGMIVSYTDETLPKAMRDQLESYGRDMWFFKARLDGKGTCQSVQTYQAGKRTEELVDYLLFDPVDLLDTPFGDPLPTTVHMVSVIDRAKIVFAQVQQLSQRQAGGWSPTLVWEPYYVDMLPSNWGAFAGMVPTCDIFSPNHVEALSLCSMVARPGQLHEAVGKACLELAALKPKRATIIRAGALGACYITADKPNEVHWTPAYWQGETHRIVDPTGAGNGFMGALSAALDQGHDVHEGVLWGTVAASFVIEQAGLPTLVGDKWNEGSVQDRLTLLRDRTN